MLPTETYLNSIDRFPRRIYPRADTYVTLYCFCKYVPYEMILLYRFHFEVVAKCTVYSAVYTKEQETVLKSVFHSSFDSHSFGGRRKGPG